MFEQFSNFKKFYRRQIVTDITVICKDCGTEFVFTAGEQEFYQQKGFSTPVRCKACRDARKANR